MTFRGGYDAIVAEASYFGGGAVTTASGRSRDWKWPATGITRRSYRPMKILRVVLRVLWRSNAVARATIVIRSDRRRAYGDWRGDAPRCAARLLQLIASPNATASAPNGPTVLPCPADAWPKAPPRFAVELVASGLDNPRLIRVSVAL